jgi:arginyl-tRNA synthetase
MIELPPDPSMGDFAFPCFKLAKPLRKAPAAIAAELAGRMNDPVFERVEQVSGYINFYIDKAIYAGEVLARVLNDPGRYGGSGSGAGKTVCIDYSSINIAKRFHIGHLSTTMIGHSLKRIYEFCGWKCVGINHLGDWGTNFGRMIAAYKKWGDRAALERGGIDAITELYVRFENEAQNDPALADEGRMWFKKTEDKDAEALEIFEWFRELTMRDALQVYDMLGVAFDSYAGESFYIDKMAPMVDVLRDKGLLEESQGAYVVKLDEYDMPPCIIIKSDGTTLYTTRDLATAKYRKDTYDFAKSLYVVAYQQDLHFKQLFKVLELMGYSWAEDLTHVSYGMVSYEGKSMATRKGHVVLLSDVLEKAVQKALGIIEEKSPGLEDKEAVARQVGVGAVVFFDLYNNRIKDIDFWWDRALNFDGETGPYVQYTHARACSVLRKAGTESTAPDYTALGSPEAQNVVRAIEQFPDVVRNALERSEPSLITRYSVDLAQAFNRFYFEHRILDDSPAARSAKLELTSAVRHVISRALYLIGVAAPERM